MQLQKDLIELEEQDSMASSRLDQLSQPDTKSLLKLLVDMISTMKESEKNAQSKILQLQSELDEMRKSHDELQQASAEFKRQVVAMQSEHEQQKLFLFKQIYLPKQLLKGGNKQDAWQQILATKEEHIALLQQHNDRKIKELEFSVNQLKNSESLKRSTGSSGESSSVASTPRSPKIKTRARSHSEDGEDARPRTPRKGDSLGSKPHLPSIPLSKAKNSPRDKPPPIPKPKQPLQCLHIGIISHSISEFSSKFEKMFNRSTIQLLQNFRKFS
jgi:hypothetical protein